MLVGGIYPVGSKSSVPGATIEYFASSLHEDCTFDVPNGIKLPVTLSNSMSGVCTLVLADGTGHDGTNNKVYVARGKTTSVYGRLPSLSGNGSLQVKPAKWDGRSIDIRTNTYLSVTARP